MQGRLGIGGILIALVIGFITYIALSNVRDRNYADRPRPATTPGTGVVAPDPAEPSGAGSPGDRFGGSAGTGRERHEESVAEDDSLPVEDWGVGDPFAYDESEVPTRARVRNAFVAAIEQSFPDYRLSSDEVDRATDALVRLRSTQEALRALPFDPEHAEERRVLVEQIGESTTEFSAVLGIDPAEFTARAAGGANGIDHDALTGSRSETDRVSAAPRSPEPDSHTESEFLEIR